MTSNSTPKRAFQQITHVCALLVSALGMGHTASAETLDIPDIAPDVQTVRLTGDGITLKLTNGSVNGRKLHLSTGFNPLCGFDTKVEKQGDVLTIAVTRTGVANNWLCDPELHVALSPDLGLDLQIDKLVADMHGTFGPVTIASDNSVVNFTGDARQFHFSGSKSVSRLEFGQATRREDVQVNVPLNLSYVTFAGH